jgi:mono/diheme cytochrome c family protein
MNIRARLIINGLVFLSLLSTSGCYYDKEELLYPGTACDVTGVTYGATVTSILSAHCYSCHSAAAGNANGGGIILDSYNTLYPYVTNGKLMGSINHASGYSAMPKNATKLNACDIQKIQAWVNAGAPNN